MKYFQFLDFRLHIERVLGSIGLPEGLTIEYFSLLGYRTASVIIALTDGELRENEFDLAAREVRP